MSTYEKEDKTICKIVFNRKMETIQSGTPR